MPEDLQEIQTKIALLEKDAKTGEQIHQRLEVAIGKLSDCAISLKAMLATQEQKLAKAEQTDDDIKDDNIQFQKLKSKLIFD